MEYLAVLPRDVVVLDPMSGSGTVLRAASEREHKCFGFDLDPLAVLMARIWTTPIDTKRLEKVGGEVVTKALSTFDSVLPWVDDSEETERFIKFWYAPKQERQLTALASVLHRKRGPISDSLKIAHVSRIIITKERGASIARDTSHSRPHRVFYKNNYDVIEAFLKSVSRLAEKMHSDRLKEPVNVNRGDARRLIDLSNNSIDVVITSPPYFNAIDYLRGHRLSLVWLGYRLEDLRPIRASSIGAEISRTDFDSTTMDKLLIDAGEISQLSARGRGMVARYAMDILEFSKEMRRVLRPGGEALLVVGDSFLRGVTIFNAAINVAAAEHVGLKLQKIRERALPDSSRYLPPPSDDDSQPLARRMRKESVLTFTA